jgi:hypothetical protein
VTAGALWRCPTCGREFRAKNQWHSCVSYTIDGHFEGKPPELREAFDRLVAALQELGPVRVDAVKSSINLAGRAHFGAVRVQKNCLRVGFLLARELDDSRIAGRERLRPALVGHWVRVRSPADVDGQLLGWLGEAYALKGVAI